MWIAKQQGQRKWLSKMWQKSEIHSHIFPNEHLHCECVVLFDLLKYLDVALDITTTLEISFNTHFASCSYFLLLKVFSISAPIYL